MPSASRLSESVSSLAEMLLPHLQILYPKDADHVLTELLALIEHYQPAGFQACEPRWNESDVMLITYGDSITRADEPPLATLKTFLDRYLRGEISTVHILPFFPYSSDDGFSVIDYRQVKPELGNWPHIEALAQDYNLMFDMVINHVSRESLWFADYISDVPPANDYFIEVDPDTDLSTVIRPRSSPLKKAYDCAQEMLALLSEKAQPGIPCAQLYQTALERAGKEGLHEFFMGHGEGQVKFIGHGIGLEIDDYPVISPHFNAVLEKGMVLALEPKFVFPKKGVVGLEDDYLVTSNGTKRLAQTDQNLIQI